MGRLVSLSVQWGCHTLVFCITYLLLLTIQRDVFQSVVSFSSNGWLSPKISNPQREQSDSFNHFNFVKLHRSPSFLASISIGNPSDESGDQGWKDTRLRLALEKHFDPNRISRPEPFEKRTYVYDMSEVYGGEENLPYWFQNLRKARFKTTEVYGYLHRPEIVNEIQEIVDENLNSNFPEGIFVTGHQNIGKSFTLVNTVIQLESTGDYLVTFIPDCQKWTNSYQLVEKIFHSFGSDGVAFGINKFPTMNALQIEVETMKLIGKIDSILATLGEGKKWIFIFDQIDKILKRPIAYSGMVGDLPFPYSLMTSVIKSKRIVSIISTAATNEANYVEYHEDFVNYNHKSNMSRREVETIFFNNQNITNPKVKTLIDTTMELTGGVPGYAYLFVHKFNGDVDAFEYYIKDQVETSHYKLIKATSVQEWDDIKNSIVTSLLGMTTMNRHHYDRLYFIREQVEGLCRYHAIIPAVGNACRSLLLEDVLAYVNKNEAAILAKFRDTNYDLPVKESFME
jgi:hypothetical protein